MKKSIVESKDVIVSRLQTCFDLAINSANESYFYINLINYISIFDKSPSLQLFIKETIIPMAKDDRKHLEYLESEVVKECIEVFDLVIRYIKENSINENTIEGCSEQFLKHKSGAIVSSNGRTANLLFNVNRILHTLSEIENGKHKKFLNRFIESADDDGNVIWKTRNKNDLYEIEDNKLKRLRLTKIWFYWDKMAYLYNIYVDFEKMQKDWYDTGSWLNVMGANEAHRDLLMHLGLTEDKKDRIRHFNTDELKSALIQFHFHFKDFIDHDDTKKVKVVYNTRKRELLIGESTIPFNESKRADVLTLLFKKKSKVYFDEVLEFMLGIKAGSMPTDKQMDKKEMAKYKKNFVNYCDGINSQVAKTGYSSFLHYTSNFVEINLPYSYK